ncbi:MAG TPA: acyl-CoA dehydrogenase [Albitalea sp.]|uniref:acyl-CoA dehydrogenase family protein n=1 Tax=Piscinibacter sp. TaxID=1903157 RepID=UPI002ED4292C
MDFEPGEDQVLLRESVERCLAETYGFEVRRAIVRAGGFDPTQWQRFATMGWLGTALPDALGGIDGGAEELALVHEALGRALVLEPVAAVATLAAQTLRHADAARARELLPALVAGERIVVLAHHENGAAGRLAHVAARVEASDGGVGLSGHKCLLPGGTRAESFIVSAREPGRGSDEAALSLFLVPCDTPGLRRHDYRLIDGSSACDLVLENVRLDDAARLGPAGGGLAALDEAHALATVAALAEAVGVMDRAVSTTRGYLLDRRQFGMAIAGFQALRHRLADMVIALEQSRAMLQHALHALHDGDRPRRCRSLALAKALVGRNGRFVGAQAIQLHGGIGMTDEYPIGHCFKRLMVLDRWLGDADTLWGVASET